MSDSGGEGGGVGRSEPTAVVGCPFCDSREVELVSAWGGQLMTSQMRCRGCGVYFEAVREDLAPRAANGVRGLGEGERQL